MVGISVTVVLFGASTVPTGLLAGADQIQTTRAQLRSLQVQVVSGAAQIRQLTMAYSQDSFQAITLAQEVTADQVELSQLQSQVTTSRSVLREDAIISYTGGASVTESSAPANPSDPSIRAEYLDMAAGAISDAIDQYRIEERQLAAAQAVLSRQQAAAQNAAIATAAAREQALSAASREQQELDSLNARLTQLETAAALAAQVAAARSAPATQGLPVNGGMIAAVQTVVSPSPTPTTPTTAPSASGSGGSGGVWLQLRECESGDNYQANTGNGFYGAYQFSEATWQNLGYPGRPDLEPPAMQDQAAMKLQAEAGWGQWPACAAALGLH
jgi:hypothetical protein